MKKVSLVLFLISTIILGVNAQSKGRVCDSGITFEISNNSGWGYGEPVVVDVEPFSPAAEAGVKVGDVIMEVNGAATYLRNYQTIATWLLDATSSDIKVTIRNVDTYFKEYEIQRNCKSANALSESSLADAYAFYSLEDTNDRAFSIPVKVDPNPNVDFSDYHTFDFLKEESSLPDVDYYINSQIEKALTERGLVRNTQDPDIIVQTYYTYQPNLKYSSSRNKNLYSWRYDSEAQEMIKLPILSAEDVNAESKGEYILELGVRFFDKKYINKDKMTQIWDCRSREFLTEDYDLQDYARIHAPLLMMQYPYSSAKTIAKYVVSKKGFNYTGLNFDAKDISSITDVDANSPAERAGIRPGDRIVKVGKIKFNYSSDDLEKAYRRFIIESMPLRNPKTRFIDANGFPDCMYWSINRYSEVAELFKKEAIYAPCFSYLYAFNKYVSGPNASKVLDIEIKSQGQKKNIKVTPQVQKSVVIKAL